MSVIWKKDSQRGGRVCQVEIYWQLYLLQGNQTNWGDTYKALS
jgi:hypothetical protein